MGVKGYDLTLSLLSELETSLNMQVRYAAGLDEPSGRLALGNFPLGHSNIVLVGKCMGVC